jgi:hypothetical protein
MSPYHPTPLRIPHEVRQHILAYTFSDKIRSDAHDIRGLCLEPQYTTEEVKEKGCGIYQWPDILKFQIGNYPLSWSKNVHFVLEQTLDAFGWEYVRLAEIKNEVTLEVGVLPCYVAVYMRRSGNDVESITGEDVRQWIMDLHD